MARSETYKDGRIHVTTQSWAIMSGVFNTSENMILLQNINKYLRVKKKLLKSLTT